MYRGSRKHILDWAETPGFIPELLLLASSVPARVSAESIWMPRGYREPDEARLEQFGPVAIPRHPAWEAIVPWWLVHPEHANTPNWDIALRCEIDDRPGLVLVEAKAHAVEPKHDGKEQRPDASSNSLENRQQIDRALAEARDGLRRAGHPTGIRADACYQLCNRIAFTWRLATLGIPTALIYLGFLGDTGIDDVGEHFASVERWKNAFTAHCDRVGAARLFGERVDLGSAPAWFLVESRPVLEVSPGRPN